ncbi:hypothetical protein [Pannonibacter carbonis]|uniref:hypothetical protein n=1 Tax=Pannonibacter carbonis TaxID=2067569 RepID=UPI000D0EF90C|nr:hypothetical protein [Pannonibacter carbonis]
MTEKQSKLRQQAEIAFAKAQTGARARSRAVEEIDLIVQARNEKTMELKKARMAKELEDRAMAALAPAPRKPLKS